MSQQPTSMRRKELIAAVVGSACIALVVAVFARGRETAHDGGAEAEPLRCEPAADFGAVYQVRMQSRLKLNPRALLADHGGVGQLVSSQVSLEARLRARTLHPRGDGVVLALKLDRLEVLEGQADAAPALAAELTQPFYVALAPDCRLSEFAFAPGTSPEAINRLEALVSGFSVALTEDPKTRTWSSQEDDAHGEYSAHYNRGEGARAFVKQRVAYLRTHPHAGLGLRENLLARILTSRAPGSLDADGAWLESLDSHDHLQLTRASGALVVDLDSKVGLTRTDDHDPTFQVDYSDAYVWRDADEPPLPTKPAKPEPPDQLKTLPFELAFAEYAALLRSGKAGAATHGADFLALYLRARPEMAGMLMKMLERRELPAELQSPIFLALEMAGTPEAHAALRDGLEDVHTPENRARAAAALPDIPKPDERTIEALANTAREARAENENDQKLVRNAATYALGTLEQRVRTTNPVLAKQAVDEVRTQLSLARGSSELAAALDAIGNSGNPTFVRDLTPHLGAQDTLVRAHAVEAMGHMDPQANKDLYKGLLERESDPRVRGAIASTYADQAKRANGPSPSVVVTSSLDLLEREADPRVRGLLIEVIGPSCAGDPSVMQALAAHFRRESDPMLLKLIGKYVPADKLGT